MSNQRKSELNLIVGINGTGKTQFLATEVVAKQAKSIIVTPDASEWTNLPVISTPEDIYKLQGNARIIYSGTETLEKIKDSYFGGAIILDDAMAYLDEQTPAVLQYIYIRRRQRGVDIYIVAHGLRQLPPKCFTFASWLILFNSVENFANRKNELIPENYNRIIEAQDRIRRKVQTGQPYYKEILLLDPQIKGLHNAK